MTLTNYGVTTRRTRTISTEWVRPADWLTLPDVFAGEQKITALFAVFDNSSNFVAFTISGAYTVDWGDGTIQNFAAGATAQRNYSFSAIDSGTLSTLGYRQAIITITPQAGQNFTSVNFAVKHSQPGLQNNYATGWLDINMAGSLISALTIRDYLGMLERFNFPGVNQITDFTTFLRNCYALSLIASVDTSAGTNFTSFCAGCQSMTQLPLIDTSAGTNFANFCDGCVTLTALPDLNTSAGTNFANFCRSNFSLPVIPDLDVSSGTNFPSFCSGCVTLSRSQITGTSHTISYANMRLGQAELVEIFNNLATVVGQTITISGNWGASLLTAGERLIATSKGWTLIG